MIDKIRVGAKIMKGIFSGANDFFSVEFMVTDRCNLKCKYCCNPYAVGDKEHGYEMSMKEIENAFLKLDMLGIQRLNIPGGEPLLRRDIADIIKAALTHKFTVSLTTNGILVPNYLDILSKLSFLIISLDGEKDTHDYTRGEGSFRLALNALELSRAKGINVFLSAAVSSKTRQQDLLFLINLCKSYNTRCILQPIWNLYSYPEWYRRHEKVQELIPSYSKVKDLVAYLQMHTDKNKIFGGNHYLKYLPNIYKKFEQGKTAMSACLARRFFLVILPDGTISNCSLRPQDTLLKESVQRCSIDEIKRAKIKPVKCFVCYCYPVKVLNDFATMNAGSILDFLIHYKDIRL